MGAKASTDNPCIPNYKAEGNFFIGMKFTCSKEYPKITKQNAFDSIVGSMASNGFQIHNSNKETGLISAGIPVAGGMAQTVPINVIIRKLDKTGVRVDSTINMAGGLMAGNEEIANYFCSVYEPLKSEKSHTKSTKEEHQKIIQAPPVVQSIENKPESRATAQSTNPSATSMIVTSSKAKIRKKPSTKASIVKNLKKGEQVQVIKQQDEWFQIEVASGDVGWCHKSVLKQTN